jgi:hypothetical protein
MSSEAKQLRRNRTLLIGLFAIAIVPLIGASWLYESSRNSKPWGTTNRGELLDPIVSVEALHLTAADGSSSMVDSGQWWLVTVSNDGCSADCQNAVHQLHQLHILLGRDASRVKRGLIELGITPVAPELSQYPDVAQFSGEPQSLDPGVYIVDPLGNLVLRYSFGDAGKPVLQDLKQLLKVSHIG